MPLRDHFRAPLTNRTTWEGFHGQWPAIIVQKLGKELPSRYVAEPRVPIDAQIEIDVTTYENEDSLFSAEPTEAIDEGNGGVATAVWAPAKPTLTIETDIPDNAEYEVRIFDAEKNRRLVAAIEIVSPSNKDRPEHRQIFVAKCAALLRQGVSVVIVDLVTVRQFNLFGELYFTRP